MSLPIQSSGAEWTPEEDEQLRQEMLAVAARHPGRSLAAVLTRVGRNKLAWCFQEKKAAAC